MDKHRVSRQLSLQLFLSSSYPQVWPALEIRSGVPGEFGTSGVCVSVTASHRSYFLSFVYGEREGGENGRTPGMEQATATGAISHKDHRARDHSWAIGMWLHTSAGYFVNTLSWTRKRGFSKKRSSLEEELFGKADSALGTRGRRRGFGKSFRPPLLALLV